MKLLTLEEAAEILSTRPRHVHILTRERGLPYVKVGGLTRISEQALQEWIAANTHEGGAA